MLLDVVCLHSLQPERADEVEVVHSAVVYYQFCPLDLRETRFACSSAHICVAFSLPGNKPHQTGGCLARAELWAELGSPAGAVPLYPTHTALAWTHCKAVWEQGEAFSMLTSLKAEVPSWSSECQCHSLNNICFPPLGRSSLCSLSVLCSHGRLPTTFLWFPLGSPSPCLEVFRLSADCVPTASFQITLWDPETGWQ